MGEEAEIIKFARGFAEKGGAVSINLSGVRMGYGDLEITLDGDVKIGIRWRKK